jgi:hypothetical protein
MSATPKIYSFHSTAPGTTIDVTAGTMRYKYGTGPTADNDTTDLVSPIPIPSTGINYSLRKHTKIAWTTPPTQQIRDLIWYLANRPEVDNPSLAPASSWVGATLWAGIKNTYTEALAADLTGVVSGLSNADNYNLSSGLTVITGIVIGVEGSGSSQGFVVTQMALTPNVTPGVKSARSMFYRYKEI